MSSSSGLSGPPIKRIKQTILSFTKKDRTAFGGTVNLDLFSGTL